MNEKQYMIFPGNCFEYYGWDHSPGLSDENEPEKILVPSISAGSYGHSPGKKMVARPACARIIQPYAGV
jgi:hypothetical protein